MKELKDAAYGLIRKLYFSLDISDIDRLNAISLTKPVIYKPTADGNLLIDWGRIFTHSSNSHLPDEVHSTFKRIVETTTEEVDDFDISEIDSCTASSSFGQDYTPRINGSWFKNMTEWGEAMYPVFSNRDTFFRYTDDDWMYNVRHMENNALRREIASIHRLTWLNRTVFSQGGGSHHTALVLAQKKEQNRQYTIKAKINTHVINHSPLHDLQHEYYFLVTGEKACDDFESPMKKSDSVIHNAISKTRRHLTINRSSNPATLFVIKKSNLLVTEKAFDTWVKKQINRGTIIELSDLLKSTLKYCTEPYLHELKSICLGDSLQRNNKELSRLLHEEQQNDDSQ